MSNVFKMFECCNLSKGYSRSLIIDNQRDVYYTIPNSLYSILSSRDYFTIEEFVKSDYFHNNRDVLWEYLMFLLHNELIFKCPKKLVKNFTPINTYFNYPSIITNSIVIVSVQNYMYIKKALLQLSKLNCFNFEIIFYREVNLQQITLILDSLKELIIDDLTLILDYSIAFSIKYKNKYPFLNRVIRYNSNVNIEKYYSEIGLNLVKTILDITNNQHCGIVNTSYFNTHLSHYTESLHHNTCLNRKIAIDAEGNIKNCPSMKESFGNIRDTTLEEAINKPGFKKYWNIKKDDITKCKDCEFRHVCTDCRAYIDNPEDMYSAPLKCGYDPYTCEWEEWSTNPLKQKAIDFYGMRDIINNE